MPRISIASLDGLEKHREETFLIFCIPLSEIKNITYSVIATFLANYVYQNIQLMFYISENETMKTNQ